ncbi:MAG: polysaccharide biosynthesis protein [Planctomycetota bacterium]|nr:polysaccharide biosynthesis protein [Planctomycetota bacterium]
MSHAGSKLPTPAIAPASLRSPRARVCAPASRAQRLVIVGSEPDAGELAARVNVLAGEARVARTLTLDDVATLDPGALEAQLSEVDLVLFTAPSEDRPRVRSLARRVRSIGVACKLVTPLREVLAAPVARQRAAPKSSGTLARLDVRHHAPALGAEVLRSLVGREPTRIDHASVSKLLRGARVLVTGAGGSIGSEVARIVASFEPERIILAERSENALFEVDRQIARLFPRVARQASLHDVVDEEQTRRLLADTRPRVVFHAAAHKHVPLMEDHPAHALTNNLFGTRSIADACAESGVRRMVLISSDKAVNPSSVMGATKRLAETYIQLLHASLRSTDSGAARTSSGARLSADSGTGEPTAYSMVRFGNVLGSACSVLPIWSSQIAEGGPVTVTDPRMTRYFMTINEAALLVIQAATIEQGGEPAIGDHAAPLFVLDMGRPLRILDLAERYLRALGFEPVLDERTATRLPAEARAALRERVDSMAHQGRVAKARVMPIAFTGSRPGEKLHEELAYAAEGLAPTPHAGINWWRGGHAGAGPAAEPRVAPGGSPAQASPRVQLEAMIADLARARTLLDKAAVVESLRRWVPEMISPPEQRLAA